MSHILVLAAGLFHTKTTKAVMCPAIKSQSVCVCAQGVSLHVPLVSQRTGVTQPKSCLGLSSATMYPSVLAWFYLSQTTRLQSVQVNCFHCLMCSGCWWGVTTDTEINRHSLVLFLSELVGTKR